MRSLQCMPEVCTATVVTSVCGGSAYCVDLCGWPKEVHACVMYLFSSIFVLELSIFNSLVKHEYIFTQLCFLFQLCCSQPHVLIGICLSSMLTGSRSAPLIPVSDKKRGWRWVVLRCYHWRLSMHSQENITGQSLDPKPFFINEGCLINEGGFS